MRSTECERERERERERDERVERKSDEKAARRAEMNFLRCRTERLTYRTAVSKVRSACIPLEHKSVVD